ncbi:MAG: SpoIID/LytB domain-containing protein [Syntrophorhabdaceae bacterium]|nr:SpoIID/LytB domain-containing protein [Syntrophorhabdaceae bacterium]
MKKKEPVINVGIIDGKSPVEAELEGEFKVGPSVTLSGKISVFNSSGVIFLKEEKSGKTLKSPLIRLNGGSASKFKLFKVVIGKGFHWERHEDLWFKGNLIFKARDDGTLVAINEIHVEEYLKSVISSEMNPTAPFEFLKAHAIMSRSWLLSSLEREKGTRQGQMFINDHQADELVRWYEREDHDIYQICADDHCQRYQGISQVFSKDAVTAVLETKGCVLKYGGNICDTRYSKCCGGYTEVFSTAWADKDVAYLKNIYDGEKGPPVPCGEEKWGEWFLSRPDVYCNTEDERLLSTILKDYDRETKGFFRWKVEYRREEIEGLIEEKTGIDIGELIELIPVKRGPSGRIYSLKVTGSKKEIKVGKELEIRRILSKSHLLSSAFTIKHAYDRRGKLEKVTLFGGGWGHGVGLCQIGAAVMAKRGFNAEEILSHYFSGTKIEKLY